MTSTQPPSARVHELLQCLCDDRLDQAGVHELDQILQHDAAARRLYFQYVDLEANLYRVSDTAPASLAGDEAKRSQQRLARMVSMASEGKGVSTGGPSCSLPGQETAGGRKVRGEFAAQGKARFGLSGWRIAALFVFIASAVMTMTSPAWLPWWRNTPVATLADAVDAQWDAPQGRLDVGDHLPNGPLFLKSGYASILVDNGVKLIVQGPAHFSIDSLKVAHLDQGKLTADVPHTTAARGYCVKIPCGMVTDLGTTFGITAFANTESTVQVLKGSVQTQLFAADGNQKQQVVLTEDHAVALSPITGTLASIPAEPDAYATDIHHIPAPPEAPYARWQKFSDQLRKDPSLLAYYAFDNQAEAPQQLLNRAAATSGKFDGQIENATWDEGRFPGKQALRFNGNDSRVKINIPQQTNQLTLAMWVHMDSLPHEIIGLVMSDDWNTPAEIAWQIAQENHSVAVHDGSPLNSPAAADAVGQWVLLAATLDAQSSTITLYRNGVVQVTQKVSNAVPMKIGSAQIGSWNALTSTDRARNRTLNGRIDELAIFSRIMTDAEIQAMYREGHAHEK